VYADTTVDQTTELGPSVSHVVRVHGQAAVHPVWRSGWCKTRGGGLDVPRPGPDALIDRVDERNRSVGTVARQDVFKEHANFRTVHVLVVKDEGDVLLQQLAPTRERHPLQWGSSVAGYIYAGETYEEAARRRLREELGLETELHAVGITPMEDDGLTKFVGVFVTVADRPRVEEPDHIAAIEFRPQTELEQDIRLHADAYTDSFRHVLAFWLQQGRPGLPG